MSSRQPARRPALVLLVYTLLTLVLTWPLPLHLTTAVPGDIGDPLLNTWILAWDAHALLTDPLNLFNANSYYPLPHTLAFSEHLFSTALLALPLQLAAGEPVLAYNFSLLVTFPLAAFGMYLLARRWLGRAAGAQGAAFLAGLLFAFAPYRFAAVSHLQLLTVQWLPFALLCLDKLLARPHQKLAGDSIARHSSFILRPSSFVLRPSSFVFRHSPFAIFLILQLLAAWYLAVYTTLVLGLYGLIRLLARPRGWRALGALAGPLLLAALGTLLFARPYLPLLPDLQAARPPELAASFGAAPGDYLAAAPLNTLAGPATARFRTRPGFTEENTLWPGLVSLALALLSCLPLPRGSRRSPTPGLRLALWLVALVAVALTFAAPYRWLIDLVPAASVVRVPPRWIIPALLALAGLAAPGYSRLAARLRGSRPAGAALFGLALLLALSEGLSLPLPLASVGNTADLPAAYAWLARQPDRVAVVELPLHAAPAPEFPEVKRLYASTRGWWGLVNGYSGFTPARQTELAAALAGFPDDTSLAALRALGRQGVTHLIVHPDEAPLQRAVWDQTARWQVERETSLRPLADFGPELVYAINPAGEALFEPAPAAPEGPGRRPTFVRARLGDQVELVAYILDSSEVGSRLALYWRPDRPPAADYTVFVHLLGQDGQILAQADGPPVAGHWPTSAWLPGRIVQDSRPLPLPAGAFARLAVGLYEPASGERLPAFDSNGERLANDAVVLPLNP